MVLVRDGGVDREVGGEVELEALRERKEESAVL
jgi:hypothetical protein